MSGRLLRAAEPTRVQADLDRLADLTDSAYAGWTRTVFSEAYAEERHHVVRAMRDVGLDAAIDAGGNVVGRMAGVHRDLPPIVTGSHTDTVVGAGRFDGMVGVVGGLEVARLLRESGIQLSRDLVVVDFLGEEANDWGVSCLGSRAVSGRLTREHLDRARDSDGLLLGDALDGFGVDPDGAVDAAWSTASVHAYLELHIEQGPLLERSGSQIGVVTGIAGIERLLARFSGRPDHAGTRPMDDRRDALLAAAEAVLTIEREACGAPVHGVATTGRVDSSPGAFNIVPDQATIWSEVRSVDARWLRGARGRLAERIAAQAAERGVDVGLEWLSDQPPVQTDPTLQDVLAGAAGSLGLTWESVPSGAGHDAAHMEHLGPLGMVFVPSTGGRSHVPEEFTPSEDIAHGVDVLAESIVRADRLPARA